MRDDVIKQTDISSFDNPTFDVFKTVIKAEKMGLLENKNKQLFEVTPKKIAILRIRTYAEAGQFDAIHLISANLKNSNLHPINLAELYLDFRMTDKAVEQIKKITEEDFFDYKIAMLKYIE
jgi:hypothetical protein